LASADLDLAGLAELESLFIAQTDPDGNPLGISPAILLVPPALKATAMTLMNSSLTVGGDANVPSANPWQQRFRVESSPYMQNSNFVGASSQAWYLIAEPSQMPVIEIAALDGKVQPTIETADADFNVLGLSFRGWSDIGIALQEHRAGVKSDGSES
jgi:hypothetical protein